MCVCVLFLTIAVWCCLAAAKSDGGAASSLSTRPAANMTSGEERGEGRESRECRCREDELCAVQLSFHVCFLSVPLHHAHRDRMSVVVSRGNIRSLLTLLSSPLPPRHPLRSSTTRSALIDNSLDTRGARDATRRILTQREECRKGSDEE